MDKLGYIEIRITGSKGNIELKPDTFDIREVIPIIEQAENLLFPGDKKERPVISYKIEEGSVKHIFKTGIQAVIGFNAIIASISTHQKIDFLDINTAKAFEAFQETSIKKDWTFNISTSLQDTNNLKIDTTTHFIRNASYWADAEFYFYGKITNAGGKDKANIHIVTEELGTVIIQTPQQFLAAREENFLYKTFGIRALGKQNSETGEVDKSSLSFLDLIDYNTKYDEKYLKDLRQKAMNWLTNINPDEWLKDIRGYNA
jgi:hypothetical protein